MSIGDNIKKKRNQKGITLLEMAESIGVREATAQRYESGGIKNLKRETIIKIANVLKTTPAYLMGWEEDITTPKVIPIIARVLGRIPAGVPIEAIEDVLDEEELDPRQFSAEHVYFGLMVRGDSMYPEYLDGDIVIVQQADDAESGKDVVAYVNGYEATLKRMYKYENGNIELRAINPQYESKTFTPGEVEEIPVAVKGFVRELRRKK